MEILTNRVNVEYNYVDEFYDIFSLKIKYIKEDKSTFSKVVSLLNSVNYSKIFSIYREENKYTIYFLISKEYSRNIKLTDIFEANELEYFISNNLIKYFSQVDIIDNKEDVILNLLLSNLSITSTNSRVISCNGKLYEFIKSVKDYLISLEYTIKNKIINCRVVTFCKTNGKEGCIYKLQGDYIVKSSLEGQSYVIKGEKDKKHLVNFFSAKTYDQFKNCKMVKIQELISIFNKKYKNYINLSLEYEEFNEIKFQSHRDKAKSYKRKSFDFMDKIGINIICKIEDKRALNALKDNISLKNISFKVSDTIDRQKLNILLIHIPEYYKENNIKDEYINTNEAAVQNLTYENSFNISESSVMLDKNAFEIVLFEVLRKYELIKNRILIYNTNNLILKKYIFGQIVKDKDGYIAYELGFDEENMTFVINDNILGSNKYNKDQIYIRPKESNEIILLNQLSYYPMVDITELDSKYKETLKEISIKKDLLPLLEKLEFSLGEQNVLETIKKYIKSYDKVPMATLYEGIKKNVFPLNTDERKNHVQVLKKMNKELFNISDFIYFKPLWRRKGGSYNNAFSNLKYLHNSEGVFYYSASCKSVNEVINKGYPMRSLKLDLSQEEIKDFFLLLDVDNIRINQNVVEPFPFKYIREFIEITKK